MTSMTLNTADTIISNTSASCALEVIIYDLAVTDGSVEPSHSLECSLDLLNPIGDLFNPPLKDIKNERGQFAGACKNGQSHGLFNKNYEPLVTRDEADQIFRNRMKGFGANSIEELFEAIQVVSKRRASKSPDAVDEIISHSVEEANDNPFTKWQEEIRSKEANEVTDPDSTLLTTEDIEQIVTCLEDDNFHRFVNTIEAFIERAKDLNSYAVDPRDKRETLNSLQKAIMGACELM